MDLNIHDFEGYSVLGPDRNSFDSSKFEPSISNQDRFNL